MLRDVLSNRKQRVVLNGQVSTWTSVNAGDPQRSISGPFFAFFYINGLSDMLISIVKLFVNDSSLFSAVRDINVSAGELNEDLKNIIDSSSHWKIQKFSREIKIKTARL